MSNPPEREIGSELSDAMRHSTGSYELVIAAIAAAGLGFWIDYVLGMIPVFTLVFAIAGFVGAGYSLYLKYQEQMVIENADRAASRDAQAKRSAPADNSVLRANATCAAKQAGRSQ